MKKTWKKFNEKERRIFIYLVLGLTIITFLISGFFQSFLFKFLAGLTPFLVGLFFAALLHPMVKKIEQKTKWSRKKASIFTFFMTQFLFIVIIAILWFPISSDFLNFIERINSSEFLVRLSEQYNKIFGASNGFQIVNDIKKVVISYFESNSNNILISFGGTIGSVILLLMAAFAITVYILIDYPDYVVFIKRKMKANSFFVNFYREWGKGFRAWIKGWCLDQLFIATCSGALLFLFGVESWITLTIIMTIFNFVPFIGPIIGGLGVSLYVLAMYVGNPIVIGPFGLYNLPSTIVIFGVFIGITIIQTIESVYVVPHIYSHVASINPVAILTGLSVIGLLISPYLTPLTIPILIFIKILFHNLLKKSNE